MRRRQRSCLRQMHLEPRSIKWSLFDDEVDLDAEWVKDARRYYSNIVGKYGMQVQALLKKAAAFDIQMICSLHGPVWREKIAGW